jgi:integrase
LKLYRKKKSSFWWATFRVNGVRYRLSTKQKLKTPAGSVAADLLKDIEASRTPQPKRRAQQRLDHYAVEFLELVESIRIRKTKTYYKSGWRLLKEAKIPLSQDDKERKRLFSTMMLKEIEEKHINLLDFPGSNSNANCALKTLRRMLNLAKNSGSIAKVPTIKLREEQGRHGRLLDAEAERALIPHCRQLLKDVVVMMRDLGMRNERELLPMRVEWIDWNYKVVYVPDSKTKDGKRHVPISERVIDILRRRCGERQEGWVFPSKRAKSGHTISVGKAFRAARRAAGLPESLVLYCGRHDYGTRVYRGTGNLSATMRSMGHKDVRTTMKYQHPDMEQVRMVVNQPAMPAGVTERVQ